MQLPYSENLNIGYLSRLFDNTTNCYKFFWFQAIIRKISADQHCFSFDELINEMIADAWYMVTEYNLRLGPRDTTDNLEEVVKYIFSLGDLRSSEKRENIIAYLETTSDSQIKKFKTDLTLNVPYRLQVPFFDEISIPRKCWNGGKKELTETINRQNRLIYYFKFVGGLGTQIEIDPAWAGYLARHKEILKAWTQLKLIQYLQNRNPGTPGIADKIETPLAKKLEKARKYWGTIIEIDPSIRDIYGGVDMSQYPISVDHFVPWQFVTHDELWNLHPTTGPINSGKNNSLAQWEKYFEPLAELEFRANELRFSNVTAQAAFDYVAAYHLNNGEVYAKLYEKHLDRDTFRANLGEILERDYKAAKDHGFKEKIYYVDNNLQQIGAGPHPGKNPGKWQEV